MSILTSTSQSDSDSTSLSSSSSSSSSLPSPCSCKSYSSSQFVLEPENEGNCIAIRQNVCYPNTNERDNTTSCNVKRKVTAYNAVENTGRYKIEQHKVITRDGYILTLHHLIPIGSTQKDAKSYSLHKDAVILQHGLIQSSMLYLMSSDGGDNLAYLLADLSYDVWLSNTRGNIHSREHVSRNPYGPSNFEYWNFSVDDLIYDVEAVVKYVKSKQNNKQRLYYIGHSQGGTIGFKAFVSLPELNDIVDHFIALAPGVFINKMPCKILQLFATIIKRYPSLYYATFGNGAFVPLMEFLHNIFPIQVYEYIGYTVFNYLFHWNDSKWEKSRKYLYFSETPAGTSTKIIAHWMQQSKTGKFSKYCYGEKRNIEIYGSPNAPEYDLKLLKVPTTIIYGCKDDLIDFSKLINEVPAHVKNIKIEHHEHLDLVLAIDAKEYVYPHIISILRTDKLNTQFLDNKIDKLQIQNQQKK